MVMNGGPVARPDSMTKGKRATGSRDIGQASLLVSPGEDLGDSKEKNLAMESYPWMVD